MQKRYEYTFKRLPLGGNFFTGRFSEEYQREVRQYAQDGWRFVQAFSPAVAGHGASRYTDLIFEREL